MTQCRTVRPGLALATAGALFVAGLVLVILLVPTAEGMLMGALVGIGLATGVALLAFRLKLRSFNRGGNAFLGALAGGFLLNIFFLAAGTLVANYTGWLGNHQGYAIGYLGAALALGGVFTWHLRHGRTATVPATPEPAEESAGGLDR